MKNNKKNTWEIIRKFFNDIHLWVGLISGLFVFLICLSGTIYVYNTEIQKASSPHLHNVNPQGLKKDIDEISAIVKNESKATITSISIPSDQAQSYQVNVRTEDDKSRFGTGYYVDPYSGKILGTSKEKNSTAEFMGYMFSLHRWLLLDKIETPLIGELPNRKLGSYISGTMTILFTIGLLTGMVIWFPKKIRNWRQGLTIKFDSNWKRINHDIHNSLSLYSLVFLLLMGITGPQWSFDWYRDGLRKVLGTYQEVPKGKEGSKKEGGSRESASKERGSRAKTGDSDLGANKESELILLPTASYLAIANEVFPHQGDLRITFPSKNDELIKINKYKAGFFAPAAADQLSLKAQDASMVEKVIFRDKPFNERVSGSIKALHIGDVYGQFSKLIYFLACLIATSLPVTGTLIWINKMKKKKKKTATSRPVSSLKHESI